MRTETKIRGLKIKMTSDNVTIYNSYQINDPKKMEEILERIFNKENCFYFNHRKSKSLTNEWKAHNKLYKINLFKKYGKNWTFNNKSNIFKNCFYYILGI